MKKRNPTDATLRNIRALKARVSKLEQAAKRLTAPSKSQRRIAAIYREYDTAWDKAVPVGGKVRIRKAVKRLETRK